MVLKILSVSGGKIEIEEIQKNPEYEAVFDRLDNMGCFSIDDIIKKLDEKNIEPETSDIRFSSITEIPFKELFYILDGMLTTDLILLYGKIIHNDIIKTLINNIIISRAKHNAITENQR